MKIRVLVVDDSVVVRRILSDIIASDPEFEVVGTASDGRIALTKIAQLAPDAVTLDIEMPNLDGLQTLTELRKTHPKLPVVVLSTLTRRCAAATLDALSRGANDYITKPTDTRNPAESFARVKEQLLPKLRVLCNRRPRGVSRPIVPVAAGARAEVPLPPPVRRAPASRIDAIAIASSTGGPAALGEVLPLLPQNLPVPVFIVQHMPALFTRLLADRLATRCGVRVDEGHEGGIGLPGTAWLAPGGLHMEVVRDGTQVKVHLTEAPPENSCRPSADPLFRSVVAAFGAHTLGVVLTGMGQDGLRGCEAIVQAGGQVLAQDEASSVVWGMPGFVARAGLADKVLPIGQIAREIVDRLRLGRGSTFLSGSLRETEATDVHQRR